jgi:hypothetical protein
MKTRKYTEEQNIAMTNEEEANTLEVAPSGAIRNS